MAFTFKLTAQGEVVTAGGRVLCATALGEDIEQAQKNAYAVEEDVAVSPSIISFWR